MCKVGSFFLPALLLQLNHGKVNTEVGPVSYPHTTRANYSGSNKSNAFFKSPKPNFREPDYLEDMDNFSNLTDWLEESDSRPKKVPKNFHQSHIEGLHHFKNRVNKEKLKKPKDFSKRDIVGKNKFELDVLTNSNSLVLNFDENVIDSTTGKFNKIHSDYLKRLAEETATTEKPQPMRRQMSAVLLRRKKRRHLERILSLMQQFIYQAQGNMLIVQMLRRKYILNIKYKIGYVFALLRILKQQQLRLYSSMHFYRFYTPDPGHTYTDVADCMYYLILYEKMGKLDDDVVTTVTHLWRLEQIRVDEAAKEATKMPKRTKMTEGPAEYVYDSNDDVYPYKKVIGT